MTNEDVLNDMLRKTFPNVIFIRSINEGNKTQAIHFSEEWLNEEYKEPKTGHWEQYGNSWEDKYKCSECGKEQPKILCGERIIGYWSDYCPNCGAKMVEPQESEVQI